MRSLIVYHIVGICLSLLLGSPSLASTVFKAANAPSAIGETGHLFLVEQGLLARPFYNDFYGETDKQLTGGMQLSYLSLWSKSSLESRIHWLAITPSFKERHQSEYLKEPIGRYADWIELQETYSHLFNLGGELLRLQISLGLGHIGNHGMKHLHRDIHKIIGSSLQGLDYTQQPKGLAGSMGLELGLIDNVGEIFGWRKESMFNLGFFHNKFMTELYLNQNHVFIIDPQQRLGIEMRMIRQAESMIYLDSERLAWRFEVGAGYRYAWYRPSIKYVSPFLRGDQVGQTYLDLFAFYFAF